MSARCENWRSLHNRKVTFQKTTDYLSGNLRLAFQTQSQTVQLTGDSLSLTNNLQHTVRGLNGILVKKLEVFNPTLPLWLPELAEFNADNKWDSDSLISYWIFQTHISKLSK